MNPWACIHLGFLTGNPYGCNELHCLSGGRPALNCFICSPKHCIELFFSFHLKLSYQVIDTAAKRQQISFDLLFEWEAHPTPVLKPRTLGLCWEKDTDNELSMSEACVMLTWSNSLCKHRNIKGRQGATGTLETDSFSQTFD